MVDNNSELSVVNASDVNNSLAIYENKMLGYMAQMGLPVEGILVPINERKKIIKNFDEDMKVVLAYEKQDTYPNSWQQQRQDYLMRL